MGELASSMAHELNQPLASLVSYCGTAKSMLNTLSDLPPELADIMERASEQAHRAGSVIQHLREFISKESDHKHPIDIDQLIEQLDDLLSSELKSAKVELEHDLDRQGCKVMANKVQIEQVLVNLVRNSIEAIQGAATNGGKITVKTRVSENHSKEVTVIDNGPGIAADKSNEIFNPFQTSKATGMGMGLPISRSIIEDHGGRIWVDADRQDGSLFGINLPVYK
jgi:C4-dicarboxylate-specific signal transduction histidine kinase